MPKTNRNVLAHSVLDCVVRFSHPVRYAVSDDERYGDDELTISKLCSFLNLAEPGGASVNYQSTVQRGRSKHDDPFLKLPIVQTL